MNRNQEQKQITDPYEFCEYVGKRLASIRRSKGMTQKELAEKAEIGKTTLSGYELGQHDMSLFAFYKLSNVLGLKFPLCEDI